MRYDQLAGFAFVAGLAIAANIPVQREEVPSICKCFSSCVCSSILTKLALASTISIDTFATVANPTSVDDATGGLPHIARAQPTGSVSCMHPENMYGQITNGTCPEGVRALMNTKDCEEYCVCDPDSSVQSIVCMGGPCDNDQDLANFCMGSESGGIFGWMPYCACNVPPGFFPTTTSDYPSQTSAKASVTSTASAPPTSTISTIAKVESGSDAEYVLLCGGSDMTTQVWPRLCSDNEELFPINGQYCEQKCTCNDDGDMTCPSPAKGCTDDGTTTNICMNDSKDFTFTCLCHKQDPKLERKAYLDDAAAEMTLYGIEVESSTTRLPAIITEEAAASSVKASMSSDHLFPITPTTIWTETRSVTPTALTTMYGLASDSMHTSLAAAVVATFQAGDLASVWSKMSVSVVTPTTVHASTSVGPYETERTSLLSSVASVLSEHSVASAMSKSTMTSPRLVDRRYPSTTPGPESTKSTSSTIETSVSVANLSDTSKNQWVAWPTESSALTGSPSVPMTTIYEAQSVNGNPLKSTSVIAWTTPLSVASEFIATLEGSQKPALVTPITQGTYPPNATDATTVYGLRVFNGTTIMPAAVMPTSSVPIYLSQLSVDDATQVAVSTWTSHSQGPPGSRQTPPIDRRDSDLLMAEPLQAQELEGHAGVHTVNDYALYCQNLDNLKESDKTTTNHCQKEDYKCYCTSTGTLKCDGDYAEWSSCEDWCQCININPRPFCSYSVNLLSTCVKKRDDGGTDSWEISTEEAKELAARGEVDIRQRDLDIHPWSSVDDLGADGARYESDRASVSSIYDALTSEVASVSTEWDALWSKYESWTSAHPSAGLTMVTTPGTIAQTSAATTLKTSTVSHTDPTSHSPPKRDDFNLICEGPNMSSNIKAPSCDSNSIGIYLNGYYCQAHCGCDDNGCVSCDAQEQPGGIAQCVEDTNGLATTFCGTPHDDHFECYCKNTHGAKTGCEVLKPASGPPA